MTQEFLTKQKDIIEWLDYYSIEDYHLVPDEKYGFVVDVDGYVNLFDRELTHIPVKFRHVHEAFDCRYNALTTLEFCPKTVGWSFYCGKNQIASLEHCPEEVGKLFYCEDNPLLGDIQDISDFSEIYKKHLEHKKIEEIKREKLEIETHIQSLPKNTASQILHKI